MTATFFWHDYETTGADPRRDRPSQFAGIRTTLDLEPVGEPVEFFCKPAPDVLPHPVAALITGITPQSMQTRGVTEAEFAARVHEELAAPGTCGVGYNSLRFDDEFTRNLFYRNFYEPYAREWENGNSRWDLIDLVRMTYALRPDGIAWPRRDDGSASFKLEDLASANRLDQQRAHDALSDVHALIGLARLIRIRQPRLFDFYFGLRKKQRAFELLDVARTAPVVHVSSRYPATRGCLAIVAPIAAHPDQPNGVIVVDLDADPTPLAELDADDIADRVFTPRDALPEGVERIPLKVVHANKSPALAPLSVLQGVDHARIALDLDRCLANLERIRAIPDLAAKVRQVFARRDEAPAEQDSELAIYAGFFGDGDRRLMRDVRRTPPERLGAQRFAFRDARCEPLLFRYRARNWPETLSAEEQAQWLAQCRRRLEVQTDVTALTFDDYFEKIAQARLMPEAAGRQAVLDALDAWGRERRRELA
ncbi:exodeoxyribonuclease I [Tahibacter soli]|jgi:exodeoxyribonuclease-1|uniref:Exodeoxyribonuclease I n=1 Tax=Tahibacter soli TaxID=2983605 RepID=A0A9X3YNS2_9GAMM|nr:exodeoxyribonuclease I [Tahibacter soli]MDC8015062.1 exodeoxyribonuclease I [Tahibacter soli]